MASNYPQILFLSLFIAVYSHFEKYLFDLCDSISHAIAFEATTTIDGLSSAKGIRARRMPRWNIGGEAGRKIDSTN